MNNFAHKYQHNQIVTLNGRKAEIWLIYKDKNTDRNPTQQVQYTVAYLDNKDTAIVLESDIDTDDSTS